MKQFFQLLLLSGFIVTATTVQAQKDGRDFKAIDDYVLKLGKLDTLNMGTITSILVKNYPDKTDKVRAIYDWIAYNITYDIKTARSGGTDKSSSAEVLQYRKATGLGYANLFQDMCSVAGIRCLTANGYVKFGTSQIDEKKPEINHTWAVVQLGQSPDAWYYADPCFGSGYPDEEFRTFTKLFNPDYFFADLTIFNWQHYPDNLAWQLGGGPKSKKDFFGMPVILNAAYEFGLKRMNPNDGAIKAKAGKAFPFSYELKNNVTISKVEVEFGDGKKKKKKEVPFSFNNKLLGFTFIFPEEDAYPVTIYINGKPMIAYNVEIQ
ncbi:MAG: hypothetical protein JST86_11135 [Bacteroidetes bacterium]|nr:hypothetical protein [Bacteroidota bacterium]